MDNATAVISRQSSPKQGAWQLNWETDLRLETVSKSTQVLLTLSYTLIFYSVLVQTY